jgi:hypothetical protein
LFEPSPYPKLIKQYGPFRDWYTGLDSLPSVVATMVRCILILTFTA